MFRCNCVCIIVFFFKQKTAYEMRISDWSSDVCSSDLGRKTLDDWVREPTPYPSVKEELLVKLFSLGDVEASVLIDQVRQRLAEHQERLAYFHALMKTHYPKPAALTGRKMGHYLGFRRGVINEGSGISWCNQALALLGGRRELEGSRLKHEH